MYDTKKPLKRKRQQECELIIRLAEERITKPDKEECVNTEGSIGDCLKEEFLFDDLAQFHIVRVLKDDDAGMAKNDPGH